MKKNSIAVLGGICIDITTKISGIPKISEIYLGNGLTIRTGGKATNGALNLSRLGERVYMLGNIGDDYFGKKAIDLLNREGVNTSFVQRDNLHPTGTVIITSNVKGENTVVVNEGANIWIHKKIIDDFLKKIDKKELMIDCFYLTLEPLSTIIEYAVKEFNKRGILIFCDAAPRYRHINPLLYKNIDFLSVNELEATTMTNIKVTDGQSAKKAMLYLREKGAKHIIVTLGKLGAVLLKDGSQSMQYFPGKKVKAVDEIGAGDAFRGVFISEYLRSKNIDKAVRLANAAGAFAVTKYRALNKYILKNLSSLPDVVRS